MKLDDWVIEQHIVAGDWLAAVSAVAVLHAVSPPCPDDLTVSRINIYYRMPKLFVGLTMNSTKYLWRKGAGIYSGPSLAKGPWAIVWTTRPQHEVERLGNS